MASIFILMFFIGCMGTELPNSLLEKASPLNEAAATLIKDEIVKTNSISYEHCKEAGFLCHVTLGSVIHISESVQSSADASIQVPYGNFMVYNKEGISNKALKDQVPNGNILLYNEGISNKALKDQVSDGNFFFYNKEENSNKALKDQVPAGNFFWYNKEGISNKALKDQVPDGNILLYNKEGISNKALKDQVSDGNILLYNKEGISNKALKDQVPDGNILLYNKEGISNKVLKDQVPDGNILLYNKEGISNKVLKDQVPDGNILLYNKEGISNKALKDQVPNGNILLYNKEGISNKALKDQVPDGNILLYNKKDQSSVKQGHRILTAAHNHIEHKYAAVLFFRMATLKTAGNMMLPPLTDSSKLQSIKFLHPSLENLLGDLPTPTLLSTMNISPTSDLASKIEESHDICKGSGPEGEIKKCVTSPKAMLEFVSSILSPSSDVEANVKYLVASRQQSSFEKFTVVGSVVVADKGFVNCHTMTYPFALYMCHTVPKTAVLKVSLKDNKGDEFVVPAICRMDTSTFDSSHISFHVLHAKPGVGEICHWLPNSHVAWYAA